MVDRVAGPDDHIAVAGAFEAWSYPAYGANLTRKVSFIRKPDQPIGDDVDWVIIDFSWTCIFGHPDFANMGMAERYVFRGKPKPDELALHTRLLSDPRFRLVWRNEALNQSVFANTRVTAPQPPPAVPGPRDL
jgi:hypothetical protein